MKNFVRKVSIFLLCTLLFSGVYIYILADNSVDAFYGKVISDKYPSLIIGTSRGAQGIEPAILEKFLSAEDEIYNFAFTLKTTPWGKPYFDSILKKLSESSESSIYILECNPWAFCSFNNELGDFKESRAIPNNLISNSVNPNIEYFFGGYTGSNVSLLIKKLFYTPNESRLEVNDNGRLKVNVKYDSANIYSRTQAKIDEYEKRASSIIWDNSREAYFIQTIEYLQARGKIFVVRMPVSNEMKNLENSTFPNFSVDITDIANRLNVNFIDYSCLSDTYITTDGHHIQNIFVEQFTTKLAEDISAVLQNNRNVDFCDFEFSLLKDSKFNTAIHAKKD